MFISIQNAWDNKLEQLSRNGQFDYSTFFNTSPSSWTWSTSADFSPRNQAGGPQVSAQPSFSFPDSGRERLGRCGTCLVSVNWWLGGRSLHISLQWKWRSLTGWLSFTATGLSWLREHWCIATWEGPLYTQQFTFLAEGSLSTWFSYRNYNTVWD